MNTTRKSKSVQILPTPMIYMVHGPMKNATFKVSKNGSNYAKDKIKQPNKTGRDPRFFKFGAEKWRTLTAEQKQYWRLIATDKIFANRYTAFLSSFMKAVGEYGFDYVMANELSYHDSEKRFQRYQYHQNSLARAMRYEVDPALYEKTEESLAKYPLAHDSPLIYVRLLDFIDINNALEYKLVYRTDPITVYQYFPEKAGAVEKGYYIKTTRARIGEELYEPLDFS